MRRLLAAAAALVATASLAACSDDKAALEGYKDSSDPDLAVVKVGLITAVDTSGSAVPSARSALNAAVLGVNARGGLDGHKVEIIFCNDKADPNEAAKCARQMVDEDVVALLGGASLGDAQIQPILDAAGIPIIGMNTFSPVLFNAKNVYLPQITGLISYQAALGYAVKNDLLPVAVAMADNPAGRTFADLLDEKLKEISGGDGFVERIPVAPDTADYGPVAGVANDSGAKSLLMIISAPQQLGLMRALESQGTDIAAFLSAPSSTLDELRGRGELAERMIFAQSYPSFEDKSMDRFGDEMAAQAATGDDYAEIDNLTPLGVDAWFALQVLEEVTKGQQDITADSVTQALDDAKDLDLGGALAPWTPSKPGPEGLSRMSNTCPWFVGFENDKLSTLSDGPLCLDNIAAGDFKSEVPPAVAAAAK